MALRWPSGLAPLGPHRIHVTLKKRPAFCGHLRTAIRCVLRYRTCKENLGFADWRHEADIQAPD